jgi:hypothetical protein
MRSLRWAWPVLAIALVFFVRGRATSGRPARRLELCVLDKTVPFRNWFEHRSLYWLLVHLNVVKTDGTHYKLERDYVGAYRPAIPGDPPERTRDLAVDDVAKARLIYLADTYGVYREGLEEQGAHGGRARAQPEDLWRVDAGRSPRGRRARSMRARRSSPSSTRWEVPRATTPNDARVRARGRWTRWIGRYFAGSKTTARSRSGCGTTTSANGKSLGALKGRATSSCRTTSHCEVPPVGLEADTIGLTIERERPSIRISTRGRRLPYPYWFDIVEDRPEAKRLASFVWHLKDAGRSG